MKKKLSGKKLYSLAEAYGILHAGLRMISTYIKAAKNHRISKMFSERLMLAVTEVNGCALCSYYHARAALESGIDELEITKMLKQEFEDAPEEELSAILFAQAYAESRGKPSQVAWKRIVDIYGSETALAILCSIRIIMIGNTYGIPAGSFIRRLSGKREKTDPRSSIGYELLMLLSFIPFFLVALPHAILSNLSGQPFIK